MSSIEYRIMRKIQEAEGGIGRAEDEVLGVHGIKAQPPRRRHMTHLLLGQAEYLELWCTTSTYYWVISKYRGLTVLEVDAGNYLEVAII